MQKVLRYNILKRNNELKRVRKQLFEKRKDQEKEYERWSSQRGAALRNQRRTERRERREDWINGDLAANRDVGAKKGKLGTVHPSQMNSHEMPGYIQDGPPSKKNRFGNRVEWEGEGNQWNIIAGDRVCVVRAVEGVIGQIGVVKDVSPEKGELTITETNKADIALPEYMSPNQRLRPITSAELPIQFSDVRLVVRLPDPKTGADRDVIVRHLRGGAPHYEREYGSNVPRHTRYIAGEDYEVDWPEASIQERERELYDTTRQMVEDETYTPTIYQKPVPAGVEHELMSRYSSKRTKHDTKYVERKIIEDARSAWYERRKLVTPKEMYMEKGTKEKTIEGIEKARAEMWDVIAAEQARVS